MLDKFTRFASFYMKSFFWAILKSPQQQEIALNILESSRRRTPDPPILFIACTMQSLPGCLTEWPQGYIPNLHCTCIFRGRRKALLGEQMERKSLLRSYSLPTAHPLTAGRCSQSVTVIPWCTWLPIPFWPALATHLFSPLIHHLLLPLSK